MKPHLCKKGVAIVLWMGIFFLVSYWAGVYAESEVIQKASIIMVSFAFFTAGIYASFLLNGYKKND